MYDHIHPYALERRQRDAFDDQGFVILRGQLPADVLRSLEEAFTIAVDRLARNRNAQDEHADDEPADDAGRFAFDARYRRLRSQVDERVPSAWRKILVTPQVYDLWRRPELLGPVRSLLGHEVYAHGIWNGRPREPGQPQQQVAWHQDAHYYKDWSPDDGRLLSVWIPLVPVDGSSSCLEFIPGSHRLGRVERCRAHNGLFTVPDHLVDDRPRVAAAMEPGDVVIFSDTTLHQSTHNDSERIRWSVDIRFAEPTPTLLPKVGRGYWCFSSSDPDRVEPFGVWSERYQYEPTALLDELENFADLDRDMMRGVLARLPAHLDLY